MKKYVVNKITPFIEKSFFYAEDAKKLGVSPSHLAYYINKGEVRRLGRGVYQHSEYRGAAENFRWEDLIEAVHSVPGGVVCLISALVIYELTEQIGRQHWIAISHSTSSKQRGLIKIMRFRNMELGKTIIEIGGIPIPIFDQERTIIDSFRLLSRETAIKALKMALAKTGKERLDLKKLQIYAKKLRFNIQPYLLTAMT